MSSQHEPAAFQEPRWRRLPEERPQQIIDAALAEFGERGLAGSRLDDIAKRAGLSKCTIYLYFQNKEELFREMVRRNVISQLEENERRFGDQAGSATEALTEYMRRDWMFIRSSKFAALFRLIHAETGWPSGRLYRLSRGSGSRLRARGRAR